MALRPGGETLQKNKIIYYGVFLQNITEITEYFTTEYYGKLQSIMFPPPLLKPRLFDHKGRLIEVGGWQLSTKRWVSMKAQPVMTIGDQCYPNYKKSDLKSSTPVPISIIKKKDWILNHIG